MYSKLNDRIESLHRIDEITKVIPEGIYCIEEMIKSIDYDRSDKLSFILHMADCLPLEDMDLRCIDSDFGFGDYNEDDNRFKYYTPMYSINAAYESIYDQLQ